MQLTLSQFSPCADGITPDTACFQRALDLLAERWLRNIEPSCRAAKMQLFSNSDKITQVTQLNIHIFNISVEMINILYISFTASYSKVFSLNKDTL